MLPARHRLRESADFTAAVRGPGATRAGGRLLVVHATRTDARTAQPPRVGLVVSKGVGNAVVRSLTKRRLRASIATRLDGIPAGVDLVLRANPAAAAVSYGELDEAVGRQLAKALRS